MVCVTPSLHVTTIPWSASISSYPGRVPGYEASGSTTHFVSATTSCFFVSIALSFSRSTSAITTTSSSSSPCARPGWSRRIHVQSVLNGIYVYYHCSTNCCMQYQVVQSIIEPHLPVKKHAYRCYTELHTGCAEYDQLGSSDVCQL